MAATRQTGFLQRPTWSDGRQDHRSRALAPYVAGRSVLDLGCASGYRRPDWLHGALSEVASEIVGVDLDTEAVAAIRERGHDLVESDVADLDLGRTFDVVVAGELIEHLVCAGSLFDTARRHLVPGGALVVTTPNAFAASNFVYRLRPPARVNADHTCWFCETTLRQMVDKCGFRVDELRYVAHETPGRARSTVVTALRRVLPDQLAWNTLLAVCRPVA